MARERKVQRRAARSAFQARAHVPRAAKVSPPLARSVGRRRRMPPVLTDIFRQVRASRHARRAARGAAW